MAEQDDKYQKITNLSHRDYQFLSITNRPDHNHIVEPKCAMPTAKCKWNYQIKTQEYNHQKYGSEHCFGWSWYYSNGNNTLLCAVFFR